MEIKRANYNQKVGGIFNIKGSLSRVGVEKVR